MKSTFKGKVVIITGSSQGIGKGVAVLLAKQGASVVINARNEDKVQNVVEEFSKKGYSVMGLAGDISDKNFCHKLKERCLAAFGRIDYLICNAALASYGLIEDSTPDAYQKVVQVNIMGSINPSLILLDEIEKNKGGILLVSSLSAIVGLPNFSAYSLSKRSLVNFAESMKTELHGKGVFVGVNYPGFTRNDEKKTIVNSKGEIEALGKRNSHKGVKVNETAACIVKQLKQRKFRVYCSYRGRLIQMMYNLSPLLSLYILRLNRKRIIET